MRLPTEFLESVFFLGAGDEPQAIRYSGTGFLVSCPTNEPEHPYLFMVAARHCVEQAQRLPGRTYARLSAIGGDPSLLPVESEWFFAEKDGIDVAVLPVQTDADFHCRAAERDMFITGQQNREGVVGVGDEICVVGLFTMRQGASRNRPIVRFGSIAAMPDEPMKDDAGDDYWAYLVEVRSIGGLSGSPVFAFVPEDPGRGTWLGEAPKRIYMLGMIRGHWDLKATGEDFDYAAEELKQVNMGIATVTPAQDILDVLDQPDVASQMKKSGSVHRRMSRSE